MEPNKDLVEFDAYCADLWADDPDVQITDHPIDSNPPHGVNRQSELDRGDSLVSHVIARAKGFFGRFS